MVLPGAFPNLLANGSQGIAVGMATAIPPHNAAELCDAALFLIDNPNARSKTLLKYVQGPDFPTGGIIVDHRDAIAEAYATGRGSFRVRARWHKEDTGRGTYLIVITEVPWLVQKGRLVEKLAELLNERKLPLVADVRDESAEDIRLVIEPKSRTVDAALVMESLFRLSELESRIPLNMNVLVKGRIPKVVGLAEALTEWLAHRREVLVRRSKFRLAKIEHRLEVLGGYLIAYLNLDKVIKIIRTEDEPKPVLMKTFKLTDVQADAILNMRLRNLRKLEEMEIKQEDKDLRAERTELKKLLGSEKEQWKTVAGEIKKVRDTFGPKTPLGKRRTDLCRGAAARRGRDRGGDGRARADHGGGVGEGLDPRAARTRHRSVGRRVQGRRQPEIRVPGRDHVEDPGVRHQRALLHARRREAAGRARPWRAGAAVHRSRAGRTSWSRCSAIRAAANSWSRARRGGASSWPRTSASPTPARASRCSTSSRRTRRARFAVVEGELVATIGENRKMVIFPLDQVPELGRGRGVRLQRYKDGTLSDVKTFKGGDGLTWIDGGGRTFNLSLKELAAWRGNRSDAGRVRPDRFLTNNKFGSVMVNGNGKNGEKD